MTLLRAMSPKFSYDDAILKAFYEAETIDAAAKDAAAKLEGRIACGDVVDPATGEVLIESRRDDLQGLGADPRRRQDRQDRGPQGRQGPAHPPVAPGRPDVRPRERAPADLPAAPARQPAAAREGPRAVPREVLRHQPLPPRPRRPVPDQPQVQPGRARGADDARRPGLPQRDPLHPEAPQGPGPRRRHRPPGQPPPADDRRAGRRRAPQGLPQAPPHRPGADEPQGRRGPGPAEPDQPQEHQRGDRILLRPRRAVAGRRPDEPAGPAHPRAQALGARAGRSESQAGRLRGPRRPHLALRPDLPDRDPRRDEHRPDLLARHLRRRRRVRLPRHPVPRDQARPPDREGQVDARRRGGRGLPRPGRCPLGRPRQAQGPERHRPVPDRLPHRRHRPGPVHGHLAQADGGRLGRPDPVPRARRRQPRADGLEHAAAGRAAARGRAADRRHGARAARSR